MAGSSLLTLLDDIATLLDDVALMTRVAAKKTAGVLGDDLALNAQQVSGVAADRELPVVRAVAIGSLKNKALLVPGALAISVVMPGLIMPLLMIGGAFLCYEGAEKLVHRLLHSRDEDDAHHTELVNAVADEAVDMVAYEREKIKGAIRTDFILSAEIIVIALGTVADAPFATQAAVLVSIALIITFGVYGLVAAIVKLDDVGLYLHGREGRVSQWFGGLLVALAPRLMKTLTIVGTAAMFMVGGGILVHGLAPVHHLFHAWVVGLAAQPGMRVFAEYALPLLLEATFGVLAGMLLVASAAGVARLRGAPADRAD